MYAYGERSLAQLSTAHPVLQNIASEVILCSPYDLSILSGHRGEAIQNEYFATGMSTKKFPFSRHNKSDDPKIEFPEEVSDALDFAPWINGRIPWGDSHIFAVVAGCFFTIAAQMNTELIWGGDWDDDGSTKDQDLMDWGHIEIKRIL